jgi:N-acyl-D-amino-acid deacylase
MLDIAVADELRCSFYANPTGARRDYLAELLKSPSILPGVSDGGAHTKFLTSGRYPTEFLAKLVRDEEVVTLEEAHQRLSALPALCAGLGSRGTLVEGAPADIVVYDYHRLAAGPIEVVEDQPAGQWRRVQRATGYRWVLVNGGVVVDDDELAPARTGALLRTAARSS